MNSVLGFQSRCCFNLFFPMFFKEKKKIINFCMYPLHIFQRGLHQPLHCTALYCRMSWVCARVRHIVRAPRTPRFSVASDRFGQNLSTSGSSALHYVQGVSHYMIIPNLYFQSTIVYLDNHFNFRVCLSICLPSILRLCVCPKTSFNFYGRITKSN